MKANQMVKNVVSKVLLSAVIASTFNTSIFACDIHGDTGFLPENKMFIPVGLKSTGGLTEVQFNQVMDKMSSLYTSTVEKSGQKFVIERRWTDGTVNAYAHQKTVGTDTIVMFGGLARHPEVTVDAMALVACHELGHHLGGAPRKTDPTTNTLSWASNEGQSDYWGTMKCLRHYFENDDNQTAVKSLNVPAKVSSSCELVYTNANEIAICERTAMAGYAVGRLFNSLMSDKSAVDFNTPDNTIVQVTFDQHPQSQCRLDTYFQASLCDHGFGEEVSKTDANIGVCSVRNGDKVGNRPLCWFKP